MNKKLIFGILGGLAVVGTIVYINRVRLKKLGQKLSKSASIATEAFAQIFTNPTKLGSSDKTNSIAEMKPELADRLLDLKNKWGKKFTATSGMRSDEKNKEVGGKKDSAHLLGEAVDISTPNENVAIHLAVQAKKTGFNRIGVGKNFVHLDISKTLPQTSWVYEGTKITKEELKNILKQV